MTIEKLDLISAVRRHFSFLEKEFGFHVVEEDPNMVLYESDTVFVLVFYEPVTTEKVGLSVSIALLDPSRRDQTGYSLDHLVRFAGHDDGKRYHWPTATTQRELDEAVEKLAEELRHFGDRALRGDVRVFDTMDAAAEMEDEEERVEFTRPKAEEAFRKKDFVSAVELYDSMAGHRTPAEDLKLAYARKRCSEGNTS